MVSQRKLKSVNSGNSETRHTGNSKTLFRRMQEEDGENGTCMAAVPAGAELRTQPEHHGRWIAAPSR